MKSLNKVLPTLALVGLGFFSVTALAYAQTAVEVVPAEGVDKALDAVPAVLGAVVVGLFARFSGPVAAIIKIMRLDQLLVNTIKAEWDKFVDEKQLKGKALTVDLKNELIARIVTEAIRWGPKAIISWAGGEEGLRQKVRARLPDFLKSIVDVAV